MITDASSFSSQDAFKKKLINALIESKEELLLYLSKKVFYIKGQPFQIDIQNPTWKTYPMDPGQKLLNIFANPSTTYVLFLLGAALLYLELQVAGGFIAGAIGALCLILSSIGFQVLPLNFGAIGLMILSFILFIIESYITSYGVLSLTALASLLIGSLFLFRTDDAYIHFSSNLVYSSVFAIACFLGLILLLIIKERKKVGNVHFNKLMGMEGVIIKELYQKNSLYYYQVKVGGELWKAKTKTHFKTGDTIAVNEQDKESLILVIS